MLKYGNFNYFYSAQTIMVEFLLSTFYFIIFCFIISKISFFREESVSKYWFIIAYGIKVFAAFLLTLVYTKYYTDRSSADIFRYYDDGLIMFNTIKSNPLDYIQMVFGLDFNHDYFHSNYYQHMNFWDRSYKDSSFSDTHIIIRFNAFVQLFSFGYFHVHNVFINFIALIGLTAIFKAFKSFFRCKERALFYSIFLIPSIMFWGSGLLKEAIILFALGIILYSYFKLIQKFKLQYLVLILLGILLIVYTKPYLILSLLIPMFGYSINRISNFKNAAFGFMISLGVFLIMINIFPQLNLVEKVSKKQQDFSQIISSVETNSGFEIAELSDGFSILQNIPKALINTVLRPYFWECNSLFVWFSAIENFTIFCFIIIALYFRKKLSNIEKNVLLFSLTFVFILFSIIGLTTPIFGAIMRYKIPGVILLMVSLLLILDLEKIQGLHPFLKRIL